MPSGDQFPLNMNTTIPSATTFFGGMSMMKPFGSINQNPFWGAGLISIYSSPPLLRRAPLLDRPNRTFNNNHDPAVMLPLAVAITPSVTSLSGGDNEDM